MYFSRVSVARGHETAVGRHFLNCYEAHRLVSNLSPSRAAAEGRILFRLEWTRAGRAGAVEGPWLWLLSPDEPRKNQHFMIETKRFDPKVVVGEHFLFKLRANAVISRRDKTGRQSRHDVVMHLKRQLKAESDRVHTNQLSQAELVHRAGTDWLDTRAEAAGFRVVPGCVAATNYTQHKRLKRAGGRDVQISTVDFEGRLEVTDARQFRSTLFKGLGPAKGLGCGLLTIMRS